MQQSSKKLKTQVDLKPERSDFQSSAYLPKVQLVSKDWQSMKFSEGASIIKHRYLRFKSDQEIQALHDRINFLEKHA